MNKHIPPVWLPFYYLFVAAIGFLSALTLNAEVHTLESSFLQPDHETKPKTLWFWMNGNVTREGITLDLEAMKEVGLGGALMFDGGDYCPEGPAKYLSPYWQEMMQHSIEEADRLGLTLGMHNCPGWSSSGGPWITPELSMKQLVWTEVTVNGSNKGDVQLPHPQVIRGFYRDAYVFAFPTQPGESTAFKDRIRRIGTKAGKVVKAGLLTDGLLDTSIKIEKEGYLEIELNNPMSVQALTLNATLHGHFPRYQLWGSDDGINFEKITEIAAIGTHSIRAPASKNFETTTGRFFRLVPKSDADLAELELHPYPRVYDWVKKSNLAYNLGHQVDIPETGEIIQGIDPESVMDLSEYLKGKGFLDWKVPEGDWTIVRLGYTSTGKHNVTASASGDGLECDKFDPKAIEFHFNYVIGTILENAGQLGGEVFNMIEVDSYEAGMQNWTERFPEEFRARAGYDILPYLPALTGRIVGDTAISERFFYDFQRAQADLMTDAYYGRLKELANENGLSFYAEGYGQGMFDELEVSGLADYPMTEFWTRSPWTPNRTVKMVSSAAHVYGKSVVAAESFTGEERTSRWLSYPYAHKVLGDTMFSWGLNQMFFHRFAHQPHPTAFPGMAMGLWGFQFERTNTWFNDSSGWLEYLTRSQSVLRQGYYVADVLYFVGERPPDVAQWTLPLMPNGYTYDLVNADVLINRITVDDGKMMLPEGNSYSVLVLPPDLEGMTMELIEKLELMVKQGVAVIGPKPKHILTLRGFPESQDILRSKAEHLWTQTNVSDSAQLDNVLQKNGVNPDFDYAGEKLDASLSWCHRVDGSTDFYFVGNRQRRVEEVVCTFRVSGKQPEIWYPETGEIRDVFLYEDLGDRTRIPLRLRQSESVFVVFRKKQTDAVVHKLIKDDQVISSTEVPVPSEPCPGSPDNFTMSVWAKPDIELRLFPEESIEGYLDETGKFYAIPAAEGDLLFGAGHSCAGVAIGRNGVFVVERTSKDAPAVLAAPMPLSGWVHVVVVYQEGVPSLYVNGEFVKEGLTSGKIVHPGIGSPAPDPKTIFHFDALDNLASNAGKLAPPSNGRVFFHEGNQTNPVFIEEPIDASEVEALFADGKPLPPVPPSIELAEGHNDAISALVWESGSYGLDKYATKTVEVQPSDTLHGPWKVSFPPKLGAPESIELETLQSLHRHEIPGVKYFGGTATYEHSLDVSEAELSEGKRLVLDLGRVEVIARVMVNGKEAGLLWKEPYRVDITHLLHPGANSLKIEVTTLLVNRLIGDEQLPPEVQFGYVAGGGTDAYSLNSATGSGIRQFPDWYLNGDPKPKGGRITFSSWGFYTADEPLVSSGLLGPVQVFHPVRINLPIE